MNLEAIHQYTAQIVKPYDPNSMPDIPQSPDTDSITPIIIMASIAVMVFIIVIVFLVKKRH